MNWTRIAVFGSWGLVMGVLAMFGVTKRGVEPALWVAFWLVTAFLIGSRRPDRPFAHGFLIAAVAALSNTAVTVAVFPMYLQNNPQVAEGPWGQAGAGGMRLLLVAMAPLIAAISGVVLGLLCWGATRLLARRA